MGNLEQDDITYEQEQYQGNYSSDIVTSQLELEGILPTNQKFLRSHLAERLIKLEGRPFSLHDGYDLYRAIYDIQAQTLLLKNGRQTGKTLSIANFINIDAVSIPYIKSFYISPSQIQTTRFSHTKLSAVANGSPLIKYFYGGSGVNNVFLKVLRNLAEVSLSYASDDPDRVRGVSTDRLYYDEVQDMDYVSVSLVADSCLDASLDPRKIISGTPKSLENPLEELWGRSTQTEALIACRVCNVWNKPAEKNIGKKGFICAKCGRTLDVRDFKWKDFVKDARIKGFHIPQIVLPAHANNPVKWELLLEKYETYAPAKFKNEIMAESDSQGSRFLVRSDLEQCCQDYHIGYNPSSTIAKDCMFTVAGVDWSGGGKDGSSRTVLFIAGVMSNFKFKTLYYKVYPQEDPVNSVNDVAMVCDMYGVRLVIGDQGEGALSNGILISKLGKHRVGKFRYGSFARPLELDELTGVYKLDKTTIIDNLFTYLKQEGFIFPTEVESKVLFDDIMNEFSEVTHTGKKIWTHGISRPDDCLHAMIGAWIAGKLLNRDLTFY